MPAEPKTRPTDVPVADFIASIEHPTRRADAEWTAAMLQDVTGLPPVMWGPSIVGYGSYRGPTGDWPRIGFSPRKSQLVFYLMGRSDRREAQLARLGKHKTGGGCIYVNKLADIDLDVLREMCIDAFAHMQIQHPT